MKKKIIILIQTKSRKGLLKDSNDNITTKNLPLGKGGLNKISPLVKTKVLKR